MSRKRFFIIDAMAMIFRNYHAFGVRPLTTSKGYPTSAIFGCAQFLLKLLQDEKPDYIFIATDNKAPTFRHTLYDKYKANRAEMPQDLAVQIPKIYEMFSCLGIKTIVQPGFEADDIIGTAIKKLGTDCECFIVSGDKDFMQLINEHVFLYSPKKGNEIKITDTHGVYEKFGCTPNQVIDILALVGDSSDNVPGVAGIGEKGAAKLIAEFASLEGIYENLDNISNKKQQNALRENRDLAQLAKKLVTIHQDVPLSFELQDCEYSINHISVDKLFNLFSELEFANLITRLKDWKVKESSSLTRDSQPSQPRDYRLINTPSSWHELKERLMTAKQFAFDTETTGLKVFADRPIGVSFSLEASQAFYIPLMDEQLREISVADITSDLQEIFARADCRKIAHNLKFDQQMLSRIGVKIKGMVGDSMIAAFLLDSTERSYSIDTLSKKYLNIDKIPTASLIGPKGQISMTQVPLSKLTEYACEDADCCFRLHELFLPKLYEKKLFNVYEEIELPLIKVLAKIEVTGFKVDEKTLAKLSTSLSIAAKSLEKQIYDLAGEEFNIQSPKQLQKILFEKLKIHEEIGVKLKKTKTGISTDVTVLEALSDHLLCQKILEYRSHIKLLSTYIDALPTMIEPTTGRIHTSFHQTGTATGRLSSSHPNLQNIPIRTPIGREIRTAFVTDSNWFIVSADYSQIELRILAHLANEKSLKEMFSSDEDIHRLTAAKIFGKQPDEITDDERARAKAVNYGIIYGMGSQKLAKTIKVPVREAKEFIERYFAAFPEIRTFIDRSIDFATKHGYSKTYMGRLRPIEGLDGKQGPMALANARNIAVNSPIQGTAADLIKLAMIEINKRFDENKFQARMLLQVHDELVVECPKEELEKVIDIIKESMEGSIKMDVALKTSIGYGINWLEAH